MLPSSSPVSFLATFIFMFAVDVSVLTDHDGSIYGERYNSRTHIEFRGEFEVSYHEIRMTQNWVCSLDLSVLTLFINNRRTSNSSRA
jgi:hypothetical protein